MALSCQRDTTKKGPIRDALSKGSMASYHINLLTKMKQLANTGISKKVTKLKPKRAQTI